MLWSVPASNAPAERVFSYGSLKLKLHGSNLRDKMLTSLILLKSNCKQVHIAIHHCFVKEVNLVLAVARCTCT